jgi:hypothetical protein
VGSEAIAVDVNNEASMTPLKGDRVKLAVNVPVAHSRNTVKVFSTLAQLYAKTFDLNISMQKTGLRFRGNTGFFDVLPSAGGGRVELHVNFAEETSRVPDDLRGMALCLLGAYAQAVCDEQLKIVVNTEHTSVGDIKTAQRWGLWALKKIQAKHVKEFAILPAQALRAVTPVVPI